MLLQNLRAKIGARLNGDKEAGFTLIELLVVMLILGILAAIALPAFFNQKDKAGDAKAKENAHSAQVAMETYATENGGSYLGATLAKLARHRADDLGNRRRRNRGCPPGRHHRRLRHGRRLRQSSRCLERQRVQDQKHSRNPDFPVRPKAKAAARPPAEPKGTGANNPSLSET